MTLAVLAAACGVGADQALGVTITGLNGSGVNYNSTTPQQDANWRIVALPSAFTSGTAGTTTPPYNAWIFTGGSANQNVPNGWLGGSANTGTLGFHWIGAMTNNSVALLPNPGTEGISYSVIYATNFVASEAGSVTLSLDIAADNRATVFVNGTVSGTNTNNPSIQGGTQIGSVIYNIPPTPGGETKAFSILQTAAGLTSVTSGTNTLYVVLEDVANPSGLYGNTGLLVVVPEPASISLAAGLTLTGVVALRRLRRNRLRSPSGAGG